MVSLHEGTYIGFIALGFGVGTLGTLIGAGGGFVLMPLLLLLYPQENPEKLTCISLAVVFLNALSGTEAYARMRRIDYRSGLVFGAATIPGAILGALHTSLVPRRLFDAIFGFMIIAIAAALVMRPDLIPNGRGHAHHTDNGTLRHLVEADGTTYEYSVNLFRGVVLSILVGYASSFLGIGGGIIHVPALVYFLHFPVHVATATSHFILVVMAFTGTIVHILTGSFAYGVHHMMALSIGVVLGAQLGAHLSQTIQEQWIMKILAVALGMVGVRILTMAF